MQRRHVVDLAHRVDQQIALEAEAADPHEIGFRVFQPCRDGAEIAVAEVPFEKSDFAKSALLCRLARAQGNEVHRREFAGDDCHRLRRLRGSRERVEDDFGYRVVRIAREPAGRKLHVVFCEARRAEGMVDEHFVVALRDAHRREDVRRRVRAHHQVDLVDGDELLVERAREIGPRLVVLEHPLHGAAEQAVFPVELLDIDLAHDLMDEPGRGERPGERKRASDADRRARRPSERTVRRHAQREQSAEHRANRLICGQHGFPSSVLRVRASNRPA